jgi:hypothetical protein
MGHGAVRVFWGKRQMCFSYQNWTPDLLARRITTVLLFIIVVIADFKQTGLGCEMLKLNNERYIMYDGKQSVLNVEIAG